VPLFDIIVIRDGDEELIATLSDETQAYRLKNRLKLEP